MLGTVQMGMPYGINNPHGKISEEDSINILKKAYDAGIRFLDTAEVYGAAHQVIGAYHRRFPAHKFEVVTKLPNRLKGSLAADIDKYLQDLEVNELHGLLFHSYPSYENGKAYMEELQWLKKQGYIQHLGISVYKNTEIEHVMDDDRIKIIQFPYNVFDNVNLRGAVMRKAKEKGKILHTRSSFLQGLIFASVHSNNIAALLDQELLSLKQISSEANLSVGALALNYSFQEKLIDQVVIGIDNITQLLDNLNALKKPLTDCTLQQINSIHIKNRDLLNPSLWKALLEQ